MFQVSLIPPVKTCKIKESFYLFVFFLYLPTKVFFSFPTSRLRNSNNFLFIREIKNTEKQKRKRFLLISREDIQKTIKIMCCGFSELRKRDPSHGKADKRSLFYSTDIPSQLRRDPKQSTREMMSVGLKLQRRILFD